MKRIGEASQIKKEENNKEQYETPEEKGYDGDDDEEGNKDEEGNSEDGENGHLKTSIRTKQGKIVHIYTRKIQSLLDKYYSSNKKRKRLTRGEMEPLPFRKRKWKPPSESGKVEEDSKNKDAPPIKSREKFKKTIPFHKMRFSSPSAIYLEMLGKPRIKNFSGGKRVHILNDVYKLQRFR